MALIKPSDLTGYDSDAKPVEREAPPAQSQPSKKLPWQTAVVRRGVAEGMHKGHLQIALVLSTFGNHDGTSIHPTIDTLMRVSGTSKSTVTRALRYLRETGWIQQQDQGSAYAEKASLYRLSIPE